MLHFVIGKGVCNINYSRRTIIIMLKYSWGVPSYWFVLITFVFTVRYVSGNVYIPKNWLK